jgi:hypothetical protein
MLSAKWRFSLAERLFREEKIPGEVQSDSVKPQDIVGLASTPDHHTTHKKWVDGA